MVVSPKCLNHAQVCTSTFPLLPSYYSKEGMLLDFRNSSLDAGRVLPQLFEQSRFHPSVYLAAGRFALHIETSGALEPKS